MAYKQTSDDDAREEELDGNVTRFHYTSRKPGPKTIKPVFETTEVVFQDKIYYKSINGENVTWTRIHIGHDYSGSVQLPEGTGSVALINLPNGKQRVWYEMPIKQYERSGQPKNNFVYERILLDIHTDETRLTPENFLGQ